MNFCLTLDQFISLNPKLSILVFPDHACTRGNRKKIALQTKKLTVDKHTILSLSSYYSTAYAMK